MSLGAYFERLLLVVSVDDLLHGLSKSILFAALITLISIVNGSAVTGGAEGVGRATTRSVVHSIAAIVIADMLVAFLLTR